MSTVKLVSGTRTSLPSSSLASLAAGNYCTSNVKDNTTNQPLDVVVEVAASATSPAGNLQIVVFCKASYDNSNFQTGPSTGSTTTDEAVLQFLGVVPIPISATVERKFFSVAAAYNNVLPPYFEIVIKNDLGVSLSAGTLFTSEISVTNT